MRAGRLDDAAARRPRDVWCTRCRRSSAEPPRGRLLATSPPEQSAPAASRRPACSACGAVGSCACRRARSARKRERARPRAPERRSASSQPPPCPPIASPPSSRPSTCPRRRRRRSVRRRDAPLASFLKSLLCSQAQPGECMHRACSAMAFSLHQTLQGRRVKRVTAPRHPIQPSPLPCPPTTYPMIVLCLPARAVGRAIPSMLPRTPRPSIPPRRRQAGL